MHTKPYTNVQEVNESQHSIHDRVTRPVAVPMIYSDRNQEYDNHPTTEMNKVELAAYELVAKRAEIEHLTAENRRLRQLLAHIENAISVTLAR